jgi:dTDP-glucose pyrophosphorylase
MKDLLTTLNSTIKQSMRKLTKSGERCLLVVDEEEALLGTLSDGDLRKAILSGKSPQSSISNVYNSNPFKLLEGHYSLEKAKEIFIENKLSIIPIVDKKNKVVSIESWANIFSEDHKLEKSLNSIPVVIMAGGTGSRLKPVTNILPKALLPINDVPIVNHIINKFYELGFMDFHLSVNYKSGIIKAYFEELDNDYAVSFIEEKKPLGTAGSLSALANQINEPFFVTNCDIIIDADYLDLYDFHLKHKYDITLVASSKEFTVQYGVCILDKLEGGLSHIHEKPSYDFLVNTGLYVLNQDILEIIPDNKFYHITDLISDSQKLGKKIGVYPVAEESWIDIGQWEEYKHAIDKIGI